MGATVCVKNGKKERERNRIERTNDRIPLGPASGRCDHRRQRTTLSDMGCSKQARKKTSQPFAHFLSMLKNPCNCELRPSYRPVEPLISLRQPNNSLYVLLPHLDLQSSYQKRSCCQNWRSEDRTTIPKPEWTVVRCFSLFHLKLRMCFPNLDWIPFFFCWSHQQL